MIRHQIDIVVYKRQARPPPGPCVRPVIVGLRFAPTWDPAPPLPRGQPGAASLLSLK